LGIRWQVGEGEVARVVVGASGSVRTLVDLNR
jgi:hypothetical protein